MADPLVSVVIVNYNGEALLPDCLSALFRQGFDDFEVVVVDNGSTDGSLKLFERESPRVKLIPLNENTGFARGNNIGIEASSSKYIATLNNDTIVAREWLGALVAKAEADERVGMVASKILLNREGSEIDSTGMLFYPDGMTRQRGRGEIDDGRYDAMEEVLFPSACAALYRRSMLDEVGAFDETFFSYCEDSDLGFRGRLAGWKAVFAPKAVVRHLYSQTGGKYSAFKAYQIERNHHWVLWKNLPFSNLVFSLWYRFWRYLVQLFGLLSGKGSVARLAEGMPWWKMAALLIRADLGAMSGFPGKFFIDRPGIRRRRTIPCGELKKLLQRHRISARKLMLTE